jgi:inner membrane protein
MTGRTHDLCAITALNIAFLVLPVPKMTIGTAFLAFVGATLGGIIPDLDQHTSDSWDRLPAGSIISKLFYRVFGGHRSISHSILGVFLISIVVRFILQFLKTFMTFNVDIVWAAVVIGILSHLIADTCTTEGVPWLLPLKTKFGFPPMKMFRVKTGGALESIIVYPGLLILNLYLIITRYEAYKIFMVSLGK